MNIDKSSYQKGAGLRRMRRERKARRIMEREGLSKSLINATLHGPNRATGEELARANAWGLTVQQWDEEDRFARAHPKSPAKPKSPAAKPNSSPKGKPKSSSSTHKSSIAKPKSPTKPKSSIAKPKSPTKPKSSIAKPKSPTKPKSSIAKPKSPAGKPTSSSASDWSDPAWQAASPAKSKSDDAWESGHSSLSSREEFIENNSSSEQPYDHSFASASPYLSSSPYPLRPENRPKPKSLPKPPPAREVDDYELINYDETSTDSYKPMTNPKEIDRNIVVFGHGGIKPTAFKCPKNVQIIIPGLIGICNTDGDLLKYWLYIKNKIESGKNVFDKDFYWCEILGTKFANKIYTEGMPVPEMGITFCPFYCKKFRTKGGVYENKTNPIKLPGLCKKKYEPSYKGSPVILTNRGLFEDCDSELVDVSITKSQKNGSITSELTCHGLELDKSDKDYGTVNSLSNLINNISSHYHGENIRMIILSCTIGMNEFMEFETEILSGNSQIQKIELGSYSEEILQKNYDLGIFKDPRCSNATAATRKKHKRSRRGIIKKRSTKRRRRGSRKRSTKRRRRSRKRSTKRRHRESHKRSTTHRRRSRKKSTSS
jgi:hypothetical protein